MNKTYLKIYACIRKKCNFQQPSNLCISRAALGVWSSYLKTIIQIFNRKTTDIEQLLLAEPRRLLKNQDVPMSTLRLPVAPALHH